METKKSTTTVDGDVEIIKSITIETNIHMYMDVYIRTSASKDYLFHLYIPALAAIVPAGFCGPYNYVRSFIDCNLKYFKGKVAPSINQAGYKREEKKHEEKVIRNGAITQSDCIEIIEYIEKKNEREGKSGQRIVDIDFSEMEADGNDEGYITFCIATTLKTFFCSNGS